MLSMGRTHDVIEAERDSQKLHVWYGIITNKTVGPYFFTVKRYHRNYTIGYDGKFFHSTVTRHSKYHIPVRFGACPHCSLGAELFG